MKPQHTLTTLVASFCLFTAGSACASNYIDFSYADSTFFSTESGHRVQVKVTATDNAGWKRYSQFLGASERWIWTQAGSEAIYIYNDITKISEKLVNFADPVGSRYAFNLGACTNGGMLAEKGLRMETAAGTLTDVVKMTFSSKCADGGTLEAWFAPKVGIVKWSTQSIAGPVSYDLTDGSIGGRCFGAVALQTAIRASAYFPKNFIVLRNNIAESAGATLELTNTSQQELVLRFNSGQEFEISLIDSNNQVVNTWGADKRFIQGQHDVTLAAGQTRSFGGVIAMRNLNGQPLASGQYSLRIEMKGAQTMAGTAAIQTNIRTESPLYILRTN